MDVYALLRECCAARLCAAIPAAAAVDVKICRSGFELSSALPRARGLDAQACLNALLAAEAEAPALLDGAPLFARIALEGGNLCFALTEAAYAALMRRVIASAPLPALPQRIGTRAEYALARMRMLARRGGTGCPAHPAVRRALWLCFGLGGAGAKAQGRLREAAEAALHMERAIPPRERAGFAEELGDAGKCMARLLACGIAAGGEREREEKREK